MNNAFGGITNIVIISVFIAVISGYMAFNANYTKAFRLKNKVISAIEQYEGDLENENFQETVNEYMHQLGYNIGKRANCGGPFAETGVCIEEINGTIEDDTNSDYRRSYFRVTTSIGIDIVFIRDVIKNNFLISGDTKLIEVAN